MASKKNSKSSNTRFEYLNWDDAFLANQTPLTFSQLDKLLDMFFCVAGANDNFRNPWDLDCHTSMCPVLIGEAGVGKSTVIKNWARRHQYEVKRMRMGDSMEEDNLGVVKREYDEKGHHQFSLPDWMPMTPPEGKGGIAFIDECGTGSGTHQNMISTLLTDGYETGFYGHVVEKNWFWVAATNPDTTGYLLNRSLDKRVRDRMFPIFVKPSPDEVLHHLGTHKKITDLLYKFLMMNKVLIDGVSPRKWEMIGMYAARWEKTRCVGSDDFLNLLRLNLPPGTVDQLGTFMKKGNDPDAYPIRCADIMKGDDKKVKEFVTRMKKWAKGGNDALIGATAYDMVMHLRDPDSKIPQPEIENMAEVMQEIKRADLFADIVDSNANPENREALGALLKSNKEVCRAMLNMLDNFSSEIGSGN